MTSICRNYSAAMAWMNLGYNVVPQKAADAKYPAVKWRELQHRRITPVEMRRWSALFRGGVGFITGEISGVIVIETDGPVGEKILADYERCHSCLPATLTIRSGSGRGVHRHFQHPGYKVKTKANPGIKIDIKGDAGFCILPPSRHKSGGFYRIVDPTNPAPLPEKLIEFIESAALGSSQNGGASKVAAHIHKRTFGGNIPPKKYLDVPPIETMRRMLTYLSERNYFEHRNGVTFDGAGHIVKVGWCECGMALKLAYGEAGYSLWAITHVDQRARDDASAQWASFAADCETGHVTVGTVIKAARQGGFDDGRRLRNWKHRQNSKRVRS